MFDLYNQFQTLDLVLVKRKEWQALPPLWVKEYSDYPIYWVVESFTDTEECFSKEECSRVLQKLQQREMDQGLPDLRYNFMVGGDWTVYEGRGWRYSSEHAYYKHISGMFLDVAYIGPNPHIGQRNYPSLEAMHAKQRILEYGINRGLLDSGYNQGCKERHLMPFKLKPKFYD